MKLLVTGGAGFIGAIFIIYWLKKYPNDKITKLDKLKYVGNLENLKEIVFWGSGKPRREALYVDDCTNACIYLMNNYSDKEIVNTGTG